MPDLNRVVLQVSAVDARLGPPPLEVIQAEPVAPRVLAPPPTVPLPPTPDLVTILTALLDEVRSLRQDLATRHANVWWRRLLGWSTRWSVRHLSRLSRLLRG